uniref:Uncharacterized protein n=1 Tax=Glossina palpalis gambiensis TaxID=67801 RepID=A0A1B0C4I0_9MUSC
MNMTVYQRVAIFTVVIIILSVSRIRSHEIYFNHRGFMCGHERSLYALRMLWYGSCYHNIYTRPTDSIVSLYVLHS